MQFTGIIPPVATIFHSDATFDQEGMGRLIDRLIAAGVDGLFFLGSAGEAAHMTDELRREVMGFCVAHTAGRLPLLVGAIGCGTAQVATYAKEAERAGADAVVLINPFYAGLSEEALYRHFAAVAGGLGIPSFLYNLPTATGQSLSVALVKKLALEVPEIIGLKDTIDALSHIRGMIAAVKPERPDFRILCGFDEYLLTTLILGGDGCVPASANFAPELTCGIYQAHCRGDWEQARRLQRILSFVPPLYEMGPPFYAAMKEAIRLSGVDIGTTVLPPAPAADAATCEAVACMMERVRSALADL